MVGYKRRGCLDAPSQEHIQEQSIQATMSIPVDDIYTGSAMPRGVDEIIGDLRP